MAKKDEDVTTRNVSPAELAAALERLATVADQLVVVLTAVSDSLHSIDGTLERLEMGYSNHRRGIPAT